MLDHTNTVAFRYLLHLHKESEFEDSPLELATYYHRDELVRVCLSMDNNAFARSTQECGMSWRNIESLSHVLISEMKSENDKSIKHLWLSKKKPDDEL